MHRHTVACILLLPVAFTAAAATPVNDAPRLIFRSRAHPTFEDARHTAEADGFAKKGVRAWLEASWIRKREHPAQAAMRWILTGNRRELERTKKMLLEDTPSDSGTYNRLWKNDTWTFALAYDWILASGILDDTERMRVEEKLADYVERVLDALGKPGPSLWHGWTEAANKATICALALRVHPRRKRLLEAILARYREGLLALSVAGAWPEGYPYWAGNRSIPFTVAAMCYHSAFGTWQLQDVDIRRILTRTGYWHIYALRPDDTFIRYGDIFHGVQPNYFLQQPHLDMFASVTGDALLAAFADHFRCFTHRDYTYYPTFAWMLPFAYPVRVRRPAGYDPSEPLRCLNVLPRARIFGPRGTGLLVIRNGGWNKDATVVTFRAGKYMVHHAHADAGNFTIYKYAPLAVLSGVYGGYNKPCRLLYYIRSVAANTLLILQKGEITDPVHPSFNDGGQMALMTTGSDVRSLSQWIRMSERGQPWYGAQIEAAVLNEEGYDYVAADLTGCYNSTRWKIPSSPCPPKVESVRRRLVFLVKKNVLAVIDTVRKTRTEYPVRWLLHSPTEPLVPSKGRVLAGTAHNGITAFESDTFTVINGKGRLDVQILIPRRVRLLKIGGKDFGAFVQSEESFYDAVPRGRNVTDGLSPKKTALLCGWRIEAESTRRSRTERFLVVMRATEAGDESTMHCGRLEGLPEGAFGATIGKCALIVDEGAGDERTYRVPENTHEVFVLDPPRTRKVTVLCGKEKGVTRVERGSVSRLVFSTAR